MGLSLDKLVLISALAAVPSCSTEPNYSRELVDLMGSLRHGLSSHEYSRQLSHATARYSGWLMTPERYSSRVKAEDELQRDIAKKGIVIPRANPPPIGTTGDFINLDLDSRDQTGYLDSGNTRYLSSKEHIGVSVTRQDGKVSSFILIINGKEYVKGKNIIAHDSELYRDDDVNGEAESAWSSKYDSIETRGDMTGKNDIKNMPPQKAAELSQRFLRAIKQITEAARELKQ